MRNLNSALKPNQVEKKLSFGSYSMALLRKLRHTNTIRKLTEVFISSSTFFKGRKYPGRIIDRIARNSQTA
jgi:hypothetical protein